MFSFEKTSKKGDAAIKRAGVTTKYESLRKIETPEAEKERVRRDSNSWREMCYSLRANSNIYETYQTDEALVPTNFKEIC